MAFGINDLVEQSLDFKELARKMMSIRRAFSGRFLIERIAWLGLRSLGKAFSLGRLRWGDAEFAAIAELRSAWTGEGARPYTITDERGRPSLHNLVPTQSQCKRRESRGDVELIPLGQ
jgi:hypothetical protein